MTTFRGDHDNLHHELSKLVLPQLENLGLISITDDLLKALTVNCPKVTMMSSSEQKGLTDEGFITISENWTQLKSLTISQKIPVTTAGLRALSTKCTNLSSLELVLKNSVDFKGLEWPSLEFLALHSGKLNQKHRVIAGKNVAYFEGKKLFWLGGCDTTFKIKRTRENIQSIEWLRRTVNT